MQKEGRPRRRKEVGNEARKRNKARRCSTEKLKKRINRAGLRGIEIAKQSGPTLRISGATHNTQFRECVTASKGGATNAT